MVREGSTVRVRRNAKGAPKLRPPRVEPRPSSPNAWPLRWSATRRDSAGSAVTSGYAAGRGWRVRAAQTDFAMAQPSPTTTLMSK
jgi:hypothetical protein